jgi:hypothetical protein
VTWKIDLKTEPKIGGDSSIIRVINALHINLKGSTPTD